MSITHYFSRVAIPATMAAFFFCAAAAPAQLQFAELAKQHLPPGSSSSVALGDVDGDGDPDLVFGNSGQDRLYLNDGTGRFTDATATRLPPDSDDTQAVALGDVDSDGDQDLVFGNGTHFSGQQNRLYLNDGTGKFTDATLALMPTDSDDTQAVALGDVDGDGDLDLVCGNGSSRQCPVECIDDPVPSTLYLNDGTGKFTLVASIPNRGLTAAVALGDVDGDGDQDLVFGNTALFQGFFRPSLGQNELYLNDGSGTFTDVTAVRLPPSTSASAVTFGDVDGDSDLDLVLGRGDPIIGGQNQNHVYLNDGTGTFADATAARMPIDSDRTLAVAFADVDLDGDPDLFYGNERQQNRLYLNDGSGTFSDATAARMPPDSDNTQAVAFADVDLDGDPDLVSGSNGQNRLYSNLLRHLDVPFPVTLGQPYQLDTYARYGPPRSPQSVPTDIAVVMLSAGSAQIPLPPFGTLGLDPTQLLALPALAIPQPDGVASVSLPVPNDPRLVGQSIYAQAFLVQAFLVQNPLAVYLTNWTADVIMQ